jgi:GR25 family glycosyltransferase involved in LPS biosynthesis
MPRAFQSRQSIHSNGHSSLTLSVLRILVLVGVLSIVCLVTVRKMRALRAFPSRHGVRFDTSPSASKGALRLSRPQRLQPASGDPCVASIVMADAHAPDFARGCLTEALKVPPVRPEPAQSRKNSVQGVVTFVVSVSEARSAALLARIQSLAGGADTFLPLEVVHGVTPRNGAQGMQGSHGGRLKQLKHRSLVQSSPSELAALASHVRALSAFLATPPLHAIACVLEDDAALHIHAPAVVRAAVLWLEAHPDIDMVALGYLPEPTQRTVQASEAQVAAAHEMRLQRPPVLVWPLRGASPLGAQAYLVRRSAAERIVAVLGGVQTQPEQAADALRRAVAPRPPPALLADAAPFALCVRAALVPPIVLDGGGESLVSPEHVAHARAAARAAHARGDLCLDAFVGIDARTRFEP